MSDNFDVSSLRKTSNVLDKDDRVENNIVDGYVKISPGFNREELNVKNNFNDNAFIAVDGEKCKEVQQNLSDPLDVSGFLAVLNVMVKDININSGIVDDAGLKKREETVANCIINNNGFQKTDGKVLNNNLLIFYSTAVYYRLYQQPRFDMSN